jgi:pimeloyl-ACP methyl ester carboxylesterase
MKSRKISAALIGISFICLLFTSCKKTELAFNPSGDNKSALLLYPASPGSFEVKTEKYTIPGMPKYNTGVVYYPNQDNTQGPLVLFLHGNGTGEYENYSVINKHLASNGFKVASISWPSSSYKAADKVEEIKNIFYRHIRFLYENEVSPLKNKITDDVVLMGHSRGGGAAVSYAADIEKIKNVKSVIALAPSPANMDMLEKFPLTSTTSLLVIYGSADVDVHGDMDKIVNVRRTGFKFFDDAGYEWGNTNFVKDMVFIKGLNHVTFCDNSTDYISEQSVSKPEQHIVKGYINAFLQLHINKKAGYNQFFKYQVKIPSMDPSIKISQQHVDGEKLVLTNFENDNADKFTHYAGNITYPASTINIAVNKAPLIDATSFHATKIMAIAWQQNNSKPAPVIDFAFKNKVDLSLYNHVSIRAGINSFYLNQQDKEQSFYVQLLDDNGTKSSLMPVTISASFFTTASKSYMQSFLLPLAQFKGIDIKKIKSVSLLFINKNYYQGKITIDNIEFYK